MLASSSVANSQASLAPCARAVGNGPQLSSELLWKVEAGRSLSLLFILEKLNPNCKLVLFFFFSFEICFPYLLSSEEHPENYF